jgi:hypothetical protein
MAGMVPAAEVRRAVTTPLAATVEPTTGDRHADELALTLRIVNASDATVEVLNPDLGRPSPKVNWPWSIELYRASLLMSFGYLTVSVADESGRQVDKEPLETWVTPVLRPRLALSPGESFEVVIPVGRFFRLAPGGKYRVSVEYGEAAVKVRAEGAFSVPRRRDR